MCGIVGILKLDPRGTVQEPRLRRMRDALRHRGPDDADLVVSGNAGLGHRRLSIIDIAGGHQPMASADRTTYGARRAFCTGLGGRGPPPRGTGQSRKGDRRRCSRGQGAARSRRWKGIGSAR